MTDNERLIILTEGDTSLLRLTKYAETSLTKMVETMILARFTKQTISRAKTAKLSNTRKNLELKLDAANAAELASDIADKIRGYCLDLAENDFIVDGGRKISVGPVFSPGSTKDTKII